MANGSKFFWAIDASGSTCNLLEGDPLSTSGTITITETSQFTYYVADTESFLYDVVNQMNTISAGAGGQTYSFEPVKAINDTFGRRDYRLQIRATQGAIDALPFRLAVDSGVLDILGAQGLSALNSYQESSPNASGGYDHIMTFPNAYRGCWMLPPIYRRDNRRAPNQVASSARSQGGIIATRVREKLTQRPMYFNGVPADMIFWDRIGEGISNVLSYYGTLEYMWDDALRLGKTIRMFVDESTDTLDVSTSFYEEMTVDKPQRDNMMELVEELNDVMGGTHYNVRIDARVHSEFNIP